MNAAVAVSPDPNTRKCIKCKSTFIPYSMGKDKNIVVDTGERDPEGSVINKVLDEDVVLPPVNYKCMSCRAKGAA